MAELAVEETAIPGLLVIRMPMHGDARGWFKENWQRARMTALGLPDFGPVQNNMSFNVSRGATRGIHAEPWDKLVSVGVGRVYGAWVDLRAGATFGTVFTAELGPDAAVFVPRGVGNSYQALEDGTLYSYLVNDHFRADVAYPAVTLDTPGIDWPIPLERAEVSEKDRRNPQLADVTPMPPRKTLIVGAGGQLGRALAEELPDAVAVTRAELDLADAEAVAAWPWQEYGVVINAAAYTKVDLAETSEGRAAAWAANAVAPARLAAHAREHRLTLVHYSTDYVFDGTRPEHDEDEPLSPLGVYGQSKAAGDLAVATVPRHYVLRTSWVVGDGSNFVRTMARLAREGASPTVVDDQVGRLTFASTLAQATAHLLGSPAAYGTYNVTNGGDPLSWREIAAAVFELNGRSGGDVSPTSTPAYFAEARAAGKPIAPRPLSSVMRLDKLTGTGFTPPDQRDALAAYLA